MPSPEHSRRRIPVRRRLTPARRSNAAGRGGFSLIELLIALVVLMVGIYGMLRVFPAGYAAVTGAEEQTIASQLADAELARWKLDPAALPDAVIATDYAGQVIPVTLTNSLDPESQASFQKAVTSRPDLPYLSFFKDSRFALPGGTPDNAVQFHEKVQLPESEFADLPRLAPQLLYSPSDLTPSQFDTVMGALIKKPGDLNPASQMRPLVFHRNWQPNSLYLPRTIKGERIDLRSLPQTPAGVPFYLLSHAPCDVLRTELVQQAVNIPNLTPQTRDVYFDVYDARSWRYVPWSLTIPPALKEREFSIDPSTYEFVIKLVQPMARREFKVDFTDMKTFKRIVGATVVVTHLQERAKILLPDTTQAYPDPSTIQVFERMVAMTPTDYTAALQNPASEDLWPRNAYYVDVKSTITGQIRFSPFLQTNPKEGDIAIAKVDYRVYDWQVLVFDVEVPAGGVVQLPIKGIKSGDFINPPRQQRAQPIAVGVREYFDRKGNQELHPDPVAWGKDRRSWAFVVAVDRQSGEILTDNEGVEWPTSAWMRRVRFKVNYKEGMLSFNYGPQTPEIARAGSFNWDVDTPDRAGRTYRVFCRGESDWGVQLAVASRQYGRSQTRSPAGSPSSLASGSSSGDTPLAYSWLATDAKDDPRQLYFPLSEAGQSVSVDYYWVPPGFTRPVFAEGEVHTIGAPVAIITDPIRPKVAKEWVCQLTEPLAHVPNAPNPANASSTWWGPVSVRGISVRARSTWVTRGRSSTFQDILTQVNDYGNVRGAKASLPESWHQVFVSTYLTRAPI